MVPTAVGKVEPLGVLIIPKPQLQASSKHKAKAKRVQLGLETFGRNSSLQLFPTKPALGL